MIDALQIKWMQILPILPPYPRGSQKEICCEHRMCKKAR